jgi:hypothetical protein
MGSCFYLKKNKALSWAVIKVMLPWEIKPSEGMSGFAYRETVET